jgi:hypothetical protein
VLVDPILTDHLKHFYNVAVEGFYEIQEAFQYLEDCKRFIGRPFQDPYITTERYLRYHLVAFLNGTYLL